ncbi:cytochrome b/b6 domain-containing protein [Leptodesmis sp.]|uniref:cytochrome b/b6 domain-containing protein n=1 Tax=Leptodesmis sp. TaxID=3100501 RepID=UPI0040535372
MSRSQPYQPLLLRILHNVNGLLALGAIVTGFLVYNTYDGRFGKLPIPAIEDIIDVHGTIAVTFFFFLPLFILYSFHAGKGRLIQPDSFANLSHLTEFIGQHSFHRIVNTFMLLAAILSTISGRMMKEEWLPQGDLNQIWYSLHLLAWAVLIGGLAIHLLSVARVGGAPLFQAMLSVYFRPEDSPALWGQRLNQWWQSLRSKS